MNTQIYAPEDVGMSSDRLSRIRPKLQRYVEEGRAPGYVSLIARQGKVVLCESCGYRDLEEQLSMEKDTLFRIYSMTKPVTSVAMMMLYEQGKFHLQDPVSRYIPEFGQTKVLSRIGPQGPEYAEQDRPMTVHDLLTHTAGLTYGFDYDTPIEEMYRKSCYMDSDVTLEDKIKEIAGIPLIFQPGTRWHYSVAMDVCGYLVQVLSGIPFDTYLQENIFAPLGMVDTAFHVTDEKSERMGALYAHDATDGSLLLHQDEGPLQQDFLKPTRSPMGGHGLVSTTEDYWKFSQMLLNKGEFEGTRLLGRKTIEYMTIPHVQREIIPKDDLIGMDFGLGFAIINDPARVGTINSTGAYFWGGAASTFFWVDPQEDLVGVLMTQIMDSVLPFWGDDLRLAAYQALVD